MKINKGIVLLAVLNFLFITFSFGPLQVFAHCDTMSGPVVQAAIKALETGNVNRVLIWAQKKDEEEIKKAFQKTLSVRKLNPEARNLADQYFFETLVRIHRAGEGAPYTGLKTADTDLGPAIPCADKALETGKMDALLKLIIDAVKEGLQDHFDQANRKKNFEVDDVRAGREFVEAYVIYVHYVERLYQAAKSPAEGHYQEGTSRREER